MNPFELADLLDLYAADELPEALRDFVQRSLAAEPTSADYAASLRQVAQRLSELPNVGPDPWFADRLLDRVLHEYSAADRALRRKTATGQEYS